MARARTEIAGLITAIRMYESEYDLLPIAYSSSDSTALDTAGYTQLIAILSQSDTGSNSYAATGNARKIKMLDVKRPGEYKDPWDNDYIIVVDSNANDEIDSDDVDGMQDGKALLYNIVIWSWGPDKEFNSSDANSANKDNVYSMETNWDPANGHVVR